MHRRHWTWQSNITSIHLNGFKLGKQQDSALNRREDGVVTVALRDLGWVTLKSRRTKQRLCMKMVNRLDSIPINDYVQPNERSTRHNPTKFKQIRHNARAFQDSFFVTTVVDWNKLPADTVNSQSLDSWTQKQIKPWFN